MPKKHKESQSPPSQSPPAHSPDDDVGLFRRHMADARPLMRDTVTLPPVRKRPGARFNRRDESAVFRESAQADIAPTEFESGDSISFQRPSVGRRNFRKLARGKFSVQSEIDLHGLTAGDAKIQLREFIQSSIDGGFRCVRIIHGKGLGSGGRGPVLKRNVDAWLRRWDAVLAFVSARQVDGGTGAVYVLLKKKS